MNIFEKIADWLAEEPVMPPRVGDEDLARGATAVAEAIAAEQAREEAERQRRKAQEEAERLRETIHHKTILSEDIRYKSDPGSVSGSASGSGEAWWSRDICPRRAKPNLRAAVLSFPARLLMYVNQRCDGCGKIAYTRSGVSRQIYSRITSYDDETAEKLTVMKFCIGLQLGRSDADLLMKSAGYAFSDTIPVDVAFVYAIEHKMWNIHDVSELLVRNSLPGLKIDS